MMRVIGLWLVGALLLPTGAAAQEKAAGNPLVGALERCLALRDDPRRLACLDSAAAKLVAAEREHDLVVVDREDVRRTRRSLFGLQLGNADVFAGRDKPADRIERLDTSIVSARDIGHDRWALTLAEGGRWQTTEAWTLLNNLKPGTAASIHPGALGSYVLRVPGQRVVRVQRVN